MDVALSHWTAEGEDDRAAEPPGLAPAGDVDADGRADLLVGARAHGTTGIDAGAAYLLLGSTLGAGVSGVLSGADRAFFGPEAYDRAGFAVAGIGDFDGDGRDDIAIGSPRADLDFDDPGRVYLVSSPW